MKLSTEFKIGIIGLFTLAAAIWGINYLKGKNILRGFDVYYSYFDDANGIEVASKIYMEGYQIGLVKAINYKQFSEHPIEVILSVKSSYKVPKGSLAEMYSSNILGAQAINIIPSDSKEYAVDYDTLTTMIRPDMMASLQENIAPLLSSLTGLAGTLDSLSTKLNDLAGSGKLEDIVDNTRSVTARLDAQLKPGGSFALTMANLEDISGEIKNQTGSINKTINHIENLTGSVDPASIDSIVTSLRSITPKIDLLLSQINQGEGTVGKLVYNDSLYQNLESLSLSLDKLVNDVNQHPKKYVHFSLFGGKKN
ncbi:MAG: MlaD family protein [Bacteroidota bacterium]